MPGVTEGTEQEVQFGQAYDGRVALFVNQMIFNGSYFVGLSRDLGFGINYFDREFKLTLLPQFHQIRYLFLY